jgi:DNA-binding winged helix-turn-helix (wHTH) protein
MKSFQRFRLDIANQCLWRGQERVAIPPKPYDMLRYLVDNPGRLVTQDEFLEKLWPDTYVNPELIRKYILDIRKILGDRPDKPEFIETVTKRGYRFIAPVVDESAAEPRDSNRSENNGRACSGREWETRSDPLGAGTLACQTQSVEVCTRASVGDDCSSRDRSGAPACTKWADCFIVE